MEPAPPSSSITPGGVEQREHLDVVLQQPALPAYRVPVFAELSRRLAGRLKLVYAEPSLGLRNVPAKGFEAEPEQVKRVRLGRRALRWHGSCWREAKRAGGGVLLLSWDVQNLALLPALWRARRHGIGTVLWGHGYSKREAGWRAGVRNWVGLRADTVLLYNHTAADACVEAGFDPARVFVALNSLDQRPITHATEDWRADPHRLQAFTAEHQLGGKQLMLYVSRLDPDNRVELLIEAVARLRESGRPVEAAIVGTGPGEDAVRQTAARLGVTHAVHLLGAIYDEHDLAPWFLTAAAFCYPANIGLSLLHAFGYGLPVVTSDRTEAQNPEIEALHDGINGRLYRDGDANDLTRVLAELLDDDASRRAMGDAAQQTVRERFSLEAMVDGMEAAVQAAAERAGRRGR